MRLLTALTCLAASAAFAQGTQQPPKPPVTETATAEMMDTSGKKVGTITLAQMPTGVLLRGELNGLPAGEHAFHFHQVGKCEAPFKTAGDHYNPTKREHGIGSPKGHHAGDLPNLFVPDSGNLKFDTITDSVTLKKGKTSVFDKDGTSVVIHAQADDYVSQPSGNAGDRIACGVIQKSQGTMSGSMGKGEPTGGSKTTGAGTTAPGTDAGTNPHPGH